MNTPHSIFRTANAMGLLLLAGLATGIAACDHHVKRNRPDLGINAMDVDLINSGQRITAPAHEAVKFGIRRLDETGDQSVMLGAPDFYTDTSGKLMDAQLMVDYVDYGADPQDLAGARLDAGWAVSIRSPTFPPVRTIRLTTGTGSTLFTDMVRRLESPPPPVQNKTDDPNARILVYISRTAANQASHANRFEYFFIKYMPPGKSITYKHYEGDKLTKENRFDSSETYNIYDEWENTWKYDANQPLPDRLGSINEKSDEYIRAIEDVYVKTGYWFYAGPAPAHP